MSRFADTEKEQLDLPHDAGSFPALHDASERTRVLICGDQPLYRSALSSLIERREGFRIVAESTNDLEEIESMLDANVEIVVIDFDMVTGGAHDENTLQTILAAVIPRPVVIVSSDLEPEACQAALRYGISGLVLKTSGGEVLLDALESAKRGQVWLDRHLLAQMFADASHIRRKPCGEQKRIDQLTKREREIVQVACTGITNKQIAERLSISEATVRHHLGSIFAKLGVSTRSELVVYGYRHKLAHTSLPK